MSVTSLEPESSASANSAISALFTVFEGFLWFLCPSLDCSTIISSLFPFVNCLFRIFQKNFLPLLRLKYWLCEPIFYILAFYSPFLIQNHLAFLLWWNHKNPFKPALSILQERRKGDIIKPKQGVSRHFRCTPTTDAGLPAVRFP